MKVDVFPRRRNGFKIPDRDQRSGEPIRGDLVIEGHWITPARTKPAAIIRRYGSPDTKDILAIIYEPAVKSIRGHMMVISGWELLDWKNDGRQMVLQEWVCEIVWPGPSTPGV